MTRNAHIVKNANTINEVNAITSNAVNAIPNFVIFVWLSLMLSVEP